MKIVLTYNVKHESSDRMSDDSSSTNNNYDDTYAEWDSWETIYAIRDAIALRHNVTLVEANENFFQSLRSLTPDFIFNVAEGFHGVSREAQVPAICELLQIPYLGSDPLTLSICLDKARTKEILSYHKIPNAPFTVLKSPEQVNGDYLLFPQIVKPLHEGSSKGIYNSSLVSSREELIDEVERITTNYKQPALVEAFLPGREFTVAVLGNDDNIKILPIVEINHAALPKEANPIYSYEAKWVWDHREKPLEIFSCPAQITTELKEQIEKICRDTYAILRCRDWARIDVRLDSHGTPHILEINPLPGILPREEDNSCFPKAARAAGMDYAELINEVINISADRWKLPISIR